MTGPSPAFRLILHPRMEGRLDMAIDEALAETVGEGRSLQTVRLYGFSPPTLSLGRFQRISGMYLPERLSQDRVTLVRRPTGGHAVLHDNELTYSVVLSKALIAERLGDSRKRTVYEFIAGILVAGLANLGIRGRINARQQGDIRNPDCFRSSGEFEITADDGRKLVGSAQMTTRSAVLQHGSIPLTNPGHRVARYLTLEEPRDSHEPSSLDEEAQRPLSFEEVQD
ncbi:MAG TPA: biotin/lipoate A/B protein ligase family protein, partial [Spirochaetia bacterium]|nr:biotin/lipoate A/B protein ligase family protein [Spirochaetia bacterium]